MGQSRDSSPFIEQLGVPSSQTGFKHHEDVLPRGLPGLLAKWSVVRERRDLEFDEQRAIERLGVATSPNGFARRRDILGRGLWGAIAIAQVAREDGVDWRRDLERFVDEVVLQWPMRTGNKSLVVSALYTLARQLPTRRL